MKKENLLNLTTESLRETEGCIKDSQVKINNSEKLLKIKVGGICQNTGI